MSAFNICEVDYKNYGKCVCITNGAIEVYVTIDCGPRIIKCNLTGKENIMLNDVERKAQNDVSSVFGEGKKWYIYGGHRMWVSPENMPLTYYPDNDPVKYSAEGYTVTFTPPAQEVNNLQHSIALTFDESAPSFKLMHSLKNVGNKPVKGAIWALSVMAPEGVVIAPMSTRRTGLLGNRIVALWPYTDLNDPRFVFSNRYLTVRQDPSIHSSFKFGLNADKGWVAYANHGQLLVKRFTPNHPNGLYPDGGMSVEVFTNDLFVEAETLSELKAIITGETITHEEIWHLGEAEKPAFTRDNYNAIDEYVAKYIG